MMATQTAKHSHLTVTGGQVRQIHKPIRLDSCFQQSLLLSTQLQFITFHQRSAAEAWKARSQQCSSAPKYHRPRKTTGNCEVGPTPTFCLTKLSHSPRWHHDRSTVRQVPHSAIRKMNLWILLNPSLAARLAL